MQTVKLETTPREQSGKGIARRLRASGQIPAVFYGKGIETLALSVQPKALTEAWGGELGRNAILDLEIGGKTVPAQAVDYQVHPVTRALLHVDFRAVVPDQAVTVRVPLEFVGKPKGIVLGGTLRKVFREVPVSCLPSQIPAKIVHDVSGLGLEQTVSVSALTLPEGVVVKLKPSQRLGGVYGSKRKVGGDDEEEAAAKPAK